MPLICCRRNSRHRSPMKPGEAPIAGSVAITAMLSNAQLPDDGKLQSTPTEPLLGPEASAALRNRLMGELNELESGDDAALWAHRGLPEKNKPSAVRMVLAG